jgi:hypothetical protein
METSGKDTLSWLHGIEDMLLFMRRTETADYVHQYLNLNYSDDPFNVVKKLIILAKTNLAKNDSDELFPRTINLILKAFRVISTDSTDTLDPADWAHYAKVLFPEDKLFTQLHRYFRNPNADVDIISDAFSRGQIQSKIWLTKELANIKTNYNDIMVMAAWYGQVRSILDVMLTYNRMRLLDIDPVSCAISDNVFNYLELENYKVKSCCANINDLTCYKNGYELNLHNYSDPESTVIVEKYEPDLIINTSAEHMDDAWFNQIRFKEFENNPIVAIQSNNLFDIPEHINCVHGIDHMKKKFPMKEILFEGELKLKGYKRVMLIGRP